MHSEVKPFEKRPVLGFACLFAVCLLCVLPAVTANAKETLPQADHAVLFKAQQLMDTGETGKAAKLLADHVVKHPDAHPLVDLTLGNCLLLADKPVEAAVHFRRAVAKEPGLHTAWLHLGKCLYETGDFSGAGDAFLRAYDTDPEKTASRLHFAGVGFLTAGEPDKALAAYERLMALLPEHFETEWRKSLVQVYSALNRPLDALLHIQILAEETTGKEQDQWREYLLHQYLLLNRQKDALALAKRLADAHPENPKWWRALAHLFLIEKRFSDALCTLAVYSALTPLTEQEKRLLADLYLQENAPAKAARIYADLYTSDRDPALLVRIVHCHVLAGNPQTALDWIDREEAPSPELLLQKGALLYEAGRYTEALRVFLQCAKGSGESGRALLMAGYAAWRAGDTAAAKQALEKALAFENERDAARQALDDLSGRKAG